MLTSHQQSVTSSSLFSPLTLCRLVTENKRHKADRDANSDDHVTDWAFVLIRPHARHRHQTKELSLGDGWNGSVLCHCPKTPKFTGRGRSAPQAAAFCYVESNRVDRAFLGDGNQTRGSNNADSFFLCDTHLVFSVECVLQTSPTWVAGTRRPIRHMLVTVFVFFDLASYVALTT